MTINRPQLHLIVYPDGTTNQPQPRKASKAGKPALDSFFDLQAGQIAVEQGVLDYENRAAAFDFQDRFIPLDFCRQRPLIAHGLPSRDQLIHARLFRWKNRRPEFYRIEAGSPRSESGASDQRHPPPPSRIRHQGVRGPVVQGNLQATLDLTRNAAMLRSLRITARGRGVKDRTLEITGTLDDFAHPRWQGQAMAGDLDMRLVDPMTGYPFTPEGLAHLDLTGAGEAGIALPHRRQRARR